MYLDQKYKSALLSLGLSAPKAVSPSLLSATIQSNGVTVRCVFSAAVSGFSGASGFAMTGFTNGTTTLTYASGNNTATVDFTISRPVIPSETSGVLAYTPGSIIDTHNLLALVSFSGVTVTNSSGLIPFQFVVTTTLPGSANTTFTLPAGSGTYKYLINWGDGTTPSLVTTSGAQTKVYSVSGTYTIKIYGVYPRITFTAVTTDRRKIIRVEGIGNCGWLALTFNSCSNLASFVSGVGADITGVISFTSMFGTCSSLATFDITGLSTTTVTVMSNMFVGCTAFNQSVSNLNTSNVTDMSSMFNGCTAFNQPVSNFDTSNVTTMSAMFSGCTAFNQSVSNLNTSNVTNMGSMFFGCTAFNQSVSNLNTTKVTNMSSMFFGCTAFNQPVSNFNTTKVSNMSSMFNGCTAFNQDVSGFALNALTNATTMFTSSGFNITNYDLLLVAWQGKTHNNNVVFSAGSAHYSAGPPTVARAALVVDGWTITDGGTP